MSELNVDLVVRSINYHGTELNSLIRNTRQLLFMNVDYRLFQQRQERENLNVRLGLHRFISQNLPSLFKNNQVQGKEMVKSGDSTKDCYSVMPLMPPYEAFCRIDPGDRLIHFFEVVAVGDIIIARVENLMSDGDTQLSMQCFDPQTQKSRYIEDLDIRCIVSLFEMIPLGTSRGDLLRLVVKEVRKYEQTLVGTVKKQFLCINKGQNVKLGLVPGQDLPSIYSSTRKAVNRGIKYGTMLENSQGFHDHNHVTDLCQDLGIESGLSSLVVGLNRRDAKKSFDYLARGIDSFKQGKNKEAFDHLNNALLNEPNNVEALVARGVLLSNDGTLEMALVDFEKALQINPNHHKAQKYISETMVLLSKTLIDSKKVNSLLATYDRVLAMKPENKCLIESKQKLIGHLGMRIPDHQVNIGNVTVTEITDQFHDEITIPLMLPHMINSRRRGLSKMKNLENPDNPDVKLEDEKVFSAGYRNLLKPITLSQSEFSFSLSESEEYEPKNPKGSKSRIVDKERNYRNYQPKAKSETETRVIKFIEEPNNNESGPHPVNLLKRVVLKSENSKPKMVPLQGKVPGDLVNNVEKINIKIQERKLRKNFFLGDLATKVEKINEKIEEKKLLDEAWKYPNKVDDISSGTLNKSTKTRSNSIKNSKKCKTDDGVRKSTERQKTNIRKKEMKHKMSRHEKSKERSKSIKRENEIIHPRSPNSFDLFEGSDKKIHRFNPMFESYKKQHLETFSNRNKDESAAIHHNLIDNRKQEQLNTDEAKLLQTKSKSNRINLKINHIAKKRIEKEKLNAMNKYQESLERNHPDAMKRNDFPKNKNPVAMKRHDSVDRNHPDAMKRHDSVDRNHPDAMKRKDSQERNHPDAMERNDCLIRNHPDAMKRNDSLERNHTDAMKRNDSVERNHPDAMKRNDSLQRNHPDAMKRNDSVERNHQDAMKRNDSPKRKNHSDPMKRNDSVVRNRPNSMNRNESPERKHPLQLNLPVPVPARPYARNLSAAKGFPMESDKSSTKSTVPPPPSLGIVERLFKLSNT